MPRSCSAKVERALDRPARSTTLHSPSLFELAVSSKTASSTVEIAPARPRRRTARARPERDRSPRRRTASRAGARGHQFSDAATSGPLPPALRHRLASASGQVAAQRESLARATAALDRAIDVLLPGDSVPLYSALGSAERGMLKGGVISA